MALVQDSVHVPLSEISNITLSIHSCIKDRLYLSMSLVWEQVIFGHCGPDWIASSIRHILSLRAKILQGISVSH